MKLMVVVTDTGIDLRTSPQIGQGEDSSLMLVPQAEHRISRAILFPFSIFTCCGERSVGPRPKSTPLLGVRLLGKGGMSLFPRPTRSRSEIHLRRPPPASAQSFQGRPHYDCIPPSASPLPNFSQKREIGVNSSR